MNLFTQFAHFGMRHYHMESTSITPLHAAMIVLLAGVTFMTLVVCYALTAFLLSRIFKKAGVKQWKAWVPVYNSWVTLELGSQKGFWAILAFIPLINIASAVFMYIALYHIGKKLGKPGEFVLWAIFLPIVWLAWLAFDASKWSASESQTPPPTS